MEDISTSIIEMTELEGGSTDRGPPTAGGKPGGPPDEKPEGVPITKFFSVLSPGNKVLVGIAYISAFLAGLGYPSIALVMGSITGSFDPQQETNISDVMLGLLQNIMIIAFSLWFLGYLYYALFQ